MSSNDTNTVKGAAFKFLLEIEEINPETPELVSALIYILDCAVQSSEDYIYELYNAHPPSEARGIATKELDHLEKITRFVHRRISYCRDEAFRAEKTKSSS